MYKAFALFVATLFSVSACRAVSEMPGGADTVLDKPADAKNLSRPPEQVAHDRAEAITNQTPKSKFAVTSRKDFIIGIFVQPNDWFVDRDTDMKALSKIANTLFVTAGRYKSYQEKYLKPLLDSAQAYGMQVIPIYGELEDGDTSLESLVVDYGKHPAVLGFYVKGEVGNRGESADFWFERLAQARDIVHRHSDKPVMIDIIPWEFWKGGNEYYERKFPAAKLSAIDHYIEKGLVDWLIISLGNEVEKSLPMAVKRWGDKVPLIIRTSGSFKGDSYQLTQGSDPKTAQDRARLAYSEGAIGIHYYAWKHLNFNILNRDGSMTPLYEGLQASYTTFQK